MNGLSAASLIYWIVQLSWGIFQNIMGLFLFIFLFFKDHSRQVEIYHGAIVTDWKLPSSMGLGMFIFFGHRKSKHSAEILVHEFGHTIQSFLLGPLFLPIIGIPSFVWANMSYFAEKRRKQHISYYSFYPERWANHLGRIILERNLSNNSEF